MPEFRRGAAAIEEAVSNKGGGNFKPFVPEIFWKADGDKHFVLVLTPIDETYGLDLHEFIKIPFTKSNGEESFRFESFLSRKDRSLDESYDKIEDEFGRKPRHRILGVGVELVPVLETIKGRQKPTGFEVKTDEFTRKTDDGEEKVTYPRVGIISQSSKLMWSPLKSYDESMQGPLEVLPFEITKKVPGGEPANTEYTFIPFAELPVDLSAVSEYVDGISYLGDELESVINEIEATETDLEAAQAVARAMLDKRVQELADDERYDELVGPLEELEPQPWESKNKTKAAPKKEAPARPSRPSSRKRVRKEEPEEPVAEAPEAEAEEAPPADAKKAKFDRLKARLEPKE